MCAFLIKYTIYSKKYKKKFAKYNNVKAYKYVPNLLNKYMRVCLKDTKLISRIRPSKYISIGLLLVAGWVTWHA